MTRESLRVFTISLHPLLSFQFPFAAKERGTGTYENGKRVFVVKKDFGELQFNFFAITWAVKERLFSKEERIAASKEI